jgi:hypothetical protein
VLSMSSCADILSSPVFIYQFKKYIDFFSCAVILIIEAISYKTSFYERIIV